MYSLHFDKYHTLKMICIDVFMLYTSGRKILLQMEEICGEVNKNDSWTPSRENDISPIVGVRF